MRASLPQGCVIVPVPLSTTTAEALRRFGSRHGLDVPALLAECVRLSPSFQAAIQEEYPSAAMEVFGD